MDTNTITPQVAEKVCVAITRSEKSRNAVARGAGIPATTFSRKLNGHVDFTVREIFLIAEVLDISPAKLLPEMSASSVSPFAA